MADNAEYDEELSELFTKLWDLDVNKCQPGDDYDLNLQWYVTGTNMDRPDQAKESFFKYLNEIKVFHKPTYSAFRRLLDNYKAHTGEMEEVTAQEDWENWHFLGLCCNTPLMCEAHQFLINHAKAPKDVNSFKQTLYNVWFKIYKRTREDDVANSCGFEHVFVGETRQHEVIGFHNWLQFYLQEKSGHIDYRGYFRHGTNEETEAIPSLVTIQFTWLKSNNKPIGSMFVGPSPEFELALYSVMFLMGKQKVRVQIKQNDVELTCYRHGKGIGTAFPISKCD